VKRAISNPRLSIVWLYIGAGYRRVNGGEKTTMTDNEGVDMVIQIMLAIFLGSILLPIAFGKWFNASTTAWGAGAASLWPVVPVMALIGVLYLFYRKYAQ